MTSLLNSIKQVLNEETQRQRNLEEKSVSQAQQKLMGMAYALKKGEMDEKDASPEVKKLADSMSLKDLKDFASTKHDEIPNKKEEVNEAMKVPSKGLNRSNVKSGTYEIKANRDNMNYFVRLADVNFQNLGFMHNHTPEELEKGVTQKDKELEVSIKLNVAKSIGGKTVYKNAIITVKKLVDDVKENFDADLFKEAVEVDARKKSFKEALKRIEAYKAKKSMKAEGKEEYEKFFKGAMKKFGITDLGDLEGKKEKEFYDYVDANWKAKDESTIEKVRNIVNEKRKQRAMAMNEVDEPSSQNDKDIVNFHKRNTKVKSDIE